MARCYYELNSDNSFVKLLKSNLGDNNDTIVRIIGFVNSDTFRSTYPFFDAYNDADKYKYAIKYYINKLPDGRKSVQAEYDDSSSVGNFSSMIERREAVRKVVGIMVRAYFTVMSESTKDSKPDKNYFIEHAKNTIINHAAKVLDDAFQANNSEELKNSMVSIFDNTQDESLAIAKSLELFDNATCKAWSNLITEILDDNSTFMDEVTSDPALNWYNRDLTKEEREEPNLDDNKKTPEEGFIGIDVDDVDSYASLWGDGDSGLFSNAIKHVNSIVRSYLGGLEKLKSTAFTLVDKIDDEGNVVKDLFGNVVQEKLYDYDKDNVFGISDLMNVEDCVDMIYHRADISSPSMMVDSIRRIAEQQPGFESFIMLADMLDSNDQMRFLFYNTFGKQLISKTIVTYEDGMFVSRLSNPNTDKSNALRSEYINLIKHSILNLGDIDLKEHLNSTKKLVSEYNTHIKTIADNKKNIAKGGTESTIQTYQNNIEHSTREANILKKEIANAITTDFQAYIPTITKSAISAYINDKQDRTSSEAIDKLIGYLDDLYINATKSYNNKIISDADAGQAFKRMKYLESYNDMTGDINGTPDQIKEATRAYYELAKSNYLENTLITSLENLATELYPYTAVSSDLNSPNVHGNLSSDVINSSYFTFLKNVLNRPVKAIKQGNRILTDSRSFDNFAKIKFGPNFTSHQYDYSNILIDGDGIRGLFTINEFGNFVPVKDADKLFRIELYNGSVNNETEDAATYPEISHNDFIATAFVQYFRPDINAKLNSRIQGNYFARTQADAPKTFCITAPKYDTGVTNTYGALLSIENIEDVNAMTIEADAALKDAQETKSDSKRSYKATLAQMTSFLTKEKLYDIKLGESTNAVQKKTIDGKSVDVLKTSYTTEDDDTVFTAYFTGTVVNKNGVVYFTNPKLLNVGNMANMPANLREEIRKVRIKDWSKKGFIKFKANENHVIYRQFKNAYMQELTNIGQNLVNILKFKEPVKVTLPDGTETYQVILDTKDKNGVETYHPQVQEKYAEKNQYKVFDKFHRNGDILVYDEETKKYHLTGNIFGSNRLTICTERNGQREELRNYGDELFRDKVINGKIQEKAVIDFLYGGDENGLAIYTDEKGNFESIGFTNENQEAAIDQMINDYINALVNNLQNEVSNAEHILEATHLTDFDNYVNFALNYQLMYINMDDLIEGDSKFYGGTQDFLKRAKEGQAGGIPYGIADFLEDPYSPKRVVNSILGFDGQPDTYKFVMDKGKENERPILLKNKFNAITIANTIKISDDARALEQYLIDKKILNEKEAKEYMSYFKAKTNDAQSYITFEEWVRRVIAMGEYYKYADVIEKVVNNEDLNAEDITSFIQVQKNFYYDMHFNTDFNISNPRQIKNAEFVLIPQLLDKVSYDKDGKEISRERTDLGKLYDFMIDKGIDQINTAETSKAGKRNVLTLWDDNGVAHWDKFYEYFSDTQDSSPVEEFSYTHLYRQQEVPQHVDDFNKAGIQIVKKVIDNIPDISAIPDYFDASGNIKDDISADKKEVAKLAKLKEKFLNLYTTNIKQSYDQFGRLIGAGLDENGNFKRTPEGELLMDINSLYNKLREEAKRLGCNSNELEFLTVDKNTGAPIMPSDVNIFATKFENIVNSLINKYITRQQLPGFHAAQVTGLGISEKFLGRNGQIKTADTWKGNKLRYHPIDEKTGIAQPYIEVVVPRFKVFEGLTDHEIFEVFDENGQNLIERLGLDKFIGYRIPTEGNQSVAVMKIVGFVEKAQGSTIIVPDDWVAQTGADFDVDSIYAINYNMYKVGKDDIRRPKMSRGMTTQDLLNRYERYLKLAKADFDDRTSGQEYFEDRKKDINIAKANYNDAKDKLQKAFEKLINGNTKKWVDQLDSDTKREFRKIIGNKNTNLQEKATAIVDTFADRAEPGTALNKLVNYNKKFLEALGYKDDKKAVKNEAYDIDIDELNSIRRKFLDERAIPINAMSFEEFCKLSIEEQNTKEARDAEILDTLIELLSSPFVLESTITQSNFRDITAGKKEMLEKEERIRKNRSSYNFFDQARYQEEVMSGAILKAFSVSRDTFVSICNKVRPTINKPIKVVYEEYDRKGNRRTEEELKKRFGEDNVRVVEKGRGKNKKKTFIVTHDKFGWSNDNRNIEGKYITIYTSQTTAFHLDAVKEGSILNLNTLTFGVYKTFVDMGSDYRTAIGFITQPGVKRILDAYDRSRSIFNKDFNNVYVDTAIKNVARELEIKVNDTIVDEYTPIDEVILALNSHPKFDEFRDKILKSLDMTEEEIEAFTFGKESAGIYNMGFKADLLKDRRNEDGVFKGNKELQLLFDAAVILQYHSMSGTAENITNYAAVCSPDKFGAKQTTFETNKVFFDIAELLKRTTESGKPFLSVSKDGRYIDMLKSIYPGIENIMDKEDNVDANKFTFAEREESSYPSLYYMLKYSSGTSVAIAKKLFNMHRDAIEKKLYEIADKNHLNIPINEKLYTDFKRYVTTHTMYHNNVMNIDETEAQRIFGYGRTIYVDLDVHNLTDPNEDEKKAFKELSPAQKVLFVKNNFSDPIIANMLSVNIYNGRGNNRLPNILPQVIHFNADIHNIEVAFDDFKQTYFNNNFFLRELAKDLVNYAIIAEGYQIKRNAISRIVPNGILRDMGYDSIIQFAAKNSPDQLFTEDVYESYIRSHSEKVKAYRINKQSGFDITYANSRVDVICLGNPMLNETIGRNAGIVSEKGEYPAYIRFKKNDMDILMKAVLSDNDKNLYYYPLNKLESYEHSKISAVQDNNLYFTPEAYQHRIDNIADDRKSRAKFTAAFTYAIENAIDVEIPFDINDIDLDVVPNRLVPHALALKTLREKIIDNATANQHLPGAEPGLFVISSALSSLVKKYNEQHINGLANDYMIMRLNTYNTDLSKIADGFKHNMDWYIREYEKGNEDKLQGLNDTFVDVIKRIADADDSNRKSLKKEVFLIARKSVGIRKSTLGDITSSAISNIYEDRNVLEGKPLNYAYDATRRLRNSDIAISKEHSVDDNISNAVDIVRRYVENTSKWFMSQIDDFDLNLDIDEKKSIDDDAIIAKVIENDPIGDSNWRNEFLKLILNYNDFVNKYKLVESMYSDDYDIQKNIEDINAAYRKLVSPEYKNKIENASKKFLIEFAKSTSTDDLIIDDLLTITEGFNRVGSIESWLTDALEAGIPLMQTMLKEVIGNVESARMSALKESSLNVDAFDEIEKDATNSGMKVDYDNIIDPTGKFWRDYNEYLAEDYVKFEEDLAKIEKEHGRLSPEFIKKNYEFKVWKNENFRQYYVKEYYDDYNANEHDIIYGNASRGMGAFPETLAEYRKLNDELRQIRSDISRGVGTDEQEKRMLQINQSLAVLRGATMIDGVPVVFKPGNRIYSKESCETLKAYLDRQDELAKKYNNPVDVEKFNERLEDVLNTLAKIEARYEGGVIAQDVLMSDKEYSRAFKWLRANAKLVFKDKTLQDKVSKAFDTLRKTNSENRKHDWYQNILRTASAYDAYGIVNGTLLNDDQIAFIKEQEMLANNYNPGSLIKPITGDGIVYSDDFYDGMMAKGVTNAVWKKIVLDINKILEFAYDRSTRELNLSLLSIDQLKKLKTKYELLNNKDVKKYSRSDADNAKISEYISDNVEFSTDYNAYEIQRQLALSKRREMSKKDGDAFFAAWLSANTMTVYDEDGNKEVLPNRFLYSYMKPKGNIEIIRNSDGEIVEVKNDPNQLVDVKRTNAINTLRNNIVNIITHHYLEAVGIARSKGSEYYNNWFRQNHIYDSATNTYTPIKCWLRQEYKGYNKSEGASENSGYEWISTREYYESSVKDGYKNKSYIPGRSSRYENYRSGNTKYDNASKPTMNTYEQKMKDKMLDILKQYVYGSRKDAILASGVVPTIASENVDKYSDYKWWGKQALGLAGLNSDAEFKGFYEHLDYAKDKEIDIPMLAQLYSKDSKHIPEKLSKNQYKPEQHEGKTYEEYLEEYNAMKSEADEINAKVHQTIMDRSDWKQVFKDFTIRAARAKAIEENKALMYFTLHTLKNMQAFKQPLGFVNYIRNRYMSTEDKTVYKTQSMENAYNVLETFMRRLMYEQRKKNNGIFTKAGNLMQNSASARFMAFNLTGGTVNVTYGETQIWQEAFAKQFFGKKVWIESGATYSQGIPSYFTDMWKETASTKQSALIKLFNVVDTDSVVEFVSSGVSGAIKKFRNLTFGFNSGGEHFMQNRVLFAMMESHKVIPVYDAEGKIKDVKIMTEELYNRESERMALTELFEKYEELQEEYNSFIKNIKKDENERKKYIERHLYVTEQFLETLRRDDKKDIIKDYRKFRKDIGKTRSEQWKKEKSVYEQFTLDEQGYAVFAENSHLFNMGEEGKQRVWKAVANFRNKVVYVNKKIHGVYDQLGAARLEQEWFGGVFMQFHKHLYPGIMKRYRIQGYYNEVRESVEKGSATALFDLLHITDAQLAAIHDLSPAELNALKSVRNIFQAVSSYLSAVHLRWELLPEHEKANIMRNITDNVWLVMYVAGAAMAKGLWLEKDKKDSLFYNWLMNTIDRTEMELMLYGAGIPGYGPINETKTLWRSPAAVGSSIEDAYKLMEATAIWIFGDEEDQYFKTGAHAHENKIKVYGLSLIPGVRAVNHFLDLPKNNSAFKLKANPLQKWANEWASEMTGKTIEK